MLGTIVDSEGSRSAILATEVVCKHDLRHITRRLHSPCDCSKRISSIFRKGFRHQGPHPRSQRRGNGKACSNIPFHTHILTKSLETEGDLGKQGRSAIRLEPPNRSEHQETGSNPLLKWRWTLNSVTRVSKNGFLKNEAVKEEPTDANTKAIERIKIGSNQKCIREDLSKEKMVFSQESSQAIFEAGNVELIELKTSLIRCPSCPHYALFRNSSMPMRVANMALICGRNTTTEQKEALRGSSKGKLQYTSNRWQRDETCRESQLVHELSHTWVR